MKERWRRDVYCTAGTDGMSNVGPHREWAPTLFRDYDSWPAPPFSTWGFSHPFYPPPALLLLYPRKPIGCSLGWHTRATILPSGLLHAFRVWSFDVPLWTPLASLRAWTLFRAVLPFFCLPISGISCFRSFLFLLPSRCTCLLRLRVLSASLLYFTLLPYFT